MVLGHAGQHKDEKQPWNAHQHQTHSHHNECASTVAPPGAMTKEGQNRKVNKICVIDQPTFPPLDAHFLSCLVLCIYVSFYN